MSLFDDKIKQQLAGLLRNINDPVNLAFFTQEYECSSCKEARMFAEEFSTFSTKLQLEVFDLVKNNDKADAYGVDKIPAIVVLDKDKKHSGVKFYGVPGGYEINSFISSIMEASGSREPLSQEVLSRIKAITKDIHIQVFVTLGCPYCPNAVITAHRLALENAKITADMVESATFPHLAQRYNVSSVPKIVINETHELIGAQPIQEFLRVIEKL